MRIRLLLAAAATIALAACGDAATSPRLTPTPASKDAVTITCRSGYHIATRADGTEYCESEPESTSASAATAP
jgi:nitrous oxide reductase accessory protein NosL